MSAATGATLAAAELADTPWRRTVGLLGRSGLAGGEALVLDPCYSVHTWFMRFPIDVVFIDTEGEVVRVRDRVAPFRFVWGGRRARATIELASGEACRAGLHAGIRVRIEPA